MASRLVRPGSDLRLGVHHGPDHPQLIGRRQLLRGCGAAALVGAIPALVPSTAWAYLDTSKKVPDTPFEFKIGSAVQKWADRIPDPSRAQALKWRAEYAISNALNSPAVRALGKAMPALRLAGRFLGPVGLALTAVEAVRAINSLNDTWAVKPAKDPARTGQQEGSSGTLNVQSQLNIGAYPGYQTTQTQQANMPCTQYATNPDGSQGACISREPIPPREAYYPAPINGVRQYQFSTGQIVGWETLRSYNPSTGLYTDYTFPKTYVIATYLWDKQGTLNVSAVSQLHATDARGIPLGQWSVGRTYRVDIPGTQLQRVVEVWVGEGHPDPTQQYEDVQTLVQNLASDLASAPQGADILNKILQSYGDSLLQTELMTRPIVATDMPAMTVGDWTTPFPATVPVVIGGGAQPSPVPQPDPIGGPQPIEWGQYTPPAVSPFPLPEVPAVPGPQELLDTITNPLSQLVPTQTVNVACPPIPYFDGQQVTAHCAAVEDMQPLLRNLSRLGAQVSAFFIALRD